MNHWYRPGLTVMSISNGTGPINQPWSCSSAKASHLIGRAGRTGPVLTQIEKSMDDIIKRLRKAGFPNQSAVEMCKEAADEIVRLRAAWELSEKAARLLVGTGLIDQRSRDRALTMLDRARAGTSVRDAEARDT